MYTKNLSSMTFVQKLTAFSHSVYKILCCCNRHFKQNSGNRIAGINLLTPI